MVGTTSVTYTATDRFHLIDEVYELALDGVDLSGVDAHGAAPQASGDAGGRRGDRRGARASW